MTLPDGFEAFVWRSCGIFHVAHVECRRCGIAHFALEERGGSPFLTVPKGCRCADLLPLDALEQLRVWWALKYL